MLKKKPWGRKDPAVIVCGVVGNGACTGGGSGPCRTHFGCVSAVKNMLLIKKINLCGKKTYLGVVKTPPSSSVVSLATAHARAVVLAPVAPILVIFPL